MKLTLDWNCVIEVEEVRSQCCDVLELIERHRAGSIEVALLAASASENTKSKVFPGNAEVFMARVAQLGWDDLPLVRMPGVYGLSYWDFAYYVNDADLFDQQMAAIWSIIAPKVRQELSDHLPGIRDPSDGILQSPQLAKWRNTWCDVMSAYCHIHERRDIFVTNNTRDFQANAKGLAALGMIQIATPVETVRLTAP